MKKKQRVFFQKSVSILTGLFLVFQSLTPGFFVSSRISAQDAAIVETPTPTVVPAPEQQNNDVTPEPTPVQEVATPTPNNEITPTIDPTPSIEPSITVTPEPPVEISPSVEPSVDEPSESPSDPPKEEGPPESTPSPTDTPTVTPEPTPEVLETSCEQPETTRTTSEYDWSINEFAGTAETRSPVELGVTYVFPKNTNVSVTFTCLPQDTSKRTTLKIQEVAISELKLPDGINSTTSSAYDITTGMKDGTFKYTITLPKQDNQTAEVSYIEKTLDEAKNNEIQTSEIKQIEENKINQEGTKVKASDIDHFTIFIVVNADETINDNGVDNQDYGWISDNLYATFDDKDDYAIYGFPNLNIPSGATIDGIEVIVEGQTTSRDFDISLWNKSNSNPDAYTSTKTANLGSSDNTITVGGSTEQWGKTWTNSDFDTDFKVRVDANSGGGIASLNMIQVKVYYTPLVVTPTLPYNASDDYALTAVSGIWTSVTGGSNITGLNTQEVRWGYSTGYGQSGLKFEGSGLQSFNEGSNFYLGALTHMNWPITNAASGAKLKITLQFSKPTVSPNPDFTYDFVINETTNNWPCNSGWQESGTPCDDKVTFPNSYGEKSFQIGDKLYTLRILGFVDSYPSGTPISQFVTEEQKNNTAFLVGTLSSVLVAAPQISLVQKAVNGDDADTAPGPSLTVGSTASFTYSVQNTGNVTMSSISVIDDKGVVVTCPKTTLTSGESMTCIGSTIVTLGQYTNTAHVTAIYNSTTYTSNNESAHYLGYIPAVCGDGTVNQISEQCDNGSDNTDVPCTASYNGSCTYCTANCQHITVTGPYCGDAIINGSEACDGTNLGNLPATDFQCNSCSLSLINPKVTICHASDSQTNPYNTQQPSKSADVSGHDDHNGVVWYPGIADHAWGDIIPPFYYIGGYYAGQNWTTDGQAIWNNNCVIPKGTLVVKKIVINDNGGTKAASDFSFQINGDTAIPFETDGQNEISINPGTYSVTETPVTGYDITYSNCNNISITSGQTKTCEIRNNDISPKLTVTKIVTGSTEPITSFPLFVKEPTHSYPVTSGQQYDINAGIWTVTEQNKSGYTATITGDCAIDGSITLHPGDVKACTITNKRDNGVVSFQKLVDDGSSVLGWLFTVKDASNTTVGTYHDGDTVTLPTGSYTVTESGATHYAFQGASGICTTNPTNGVINMNVTTSGGTCTFTNAYVPYCGDGMKNQGLEQCDDGNNVDGDRCNSTCQIEACPNLLLTEYVEGTGDNKAIEIYNPTSATIDLAADTYQISMYFNGSMSPGLTINLTGTIASGSTYVVINNHATDPTLISKANQVYSGSTGWFNGDDAIVLKQNNVVIDTIGQIGYQPLSGEWGTGLTSTKDNTLAKKCGLSCGDKNGYNSFDPAIQWNGYATNTFSLLGTHSPACHCGDGFVNQETEQCDDGNTTNGDGCSATCQEEPGSITFIKSANPHDTQSFNFTYGSNAYPIGDFSLIDDNNGDGSEQVTFSSIPAGTYSWTENTDPNWTLSDISCQETQLGNSTVSVAQKKATIMLDPGEQVTCTFTNTRKTYPLYVTKFDDLNNNAVQDSGEPTLDGWTMELYDNETCSGSPSASVVTNSNGTPGTARFDTLNSGQTYWVKEVEQPETWMNTTGNCVATTIHDDIHSNNQVLFGNFKYGVVDGHKFNDANKNAQLDTGESYLPEWGIRLYKSNNDGGWNHIGTTNTNSDGIYTFGGLILGTYKVCEVLQNEWTQTYPTTGAARENDDEAQYCHEFSIRQSGQTVSKDFGNTNTGNMIVTKFEDLNGNGVWDKDTESVMNDWEINVNGQKSQLTGSGDNEKGQAAFNNLTQGTYYLSETQQDGWKQTGLYCENTGPGTKITKTGEAYGHHGNCGGWNGCGDAKTCAQWACEINGYTTLVSYGADKQCTQFNNCHLFYSRGSIQWNWGNWCEVQGVTDIVCTGRSVTDASGNSTDEQTKTASFFPIEKVNAQEGPTGYPATVTAGGQTNCYIGNQYIPAKLEVSKENNATTTLLPGSSVLYTLTVTSRDNTSYGVKLTDLLPKGFAYRAGSWTASSDKHGALAIGEPTYHSPGTWNIGTIEKDEVVTLTLMADISADEKPGTYKDLALAYGCQRNNDCELGNTNSITASAIDPGQLDDIFVGTEVTIIKDQQDSKTLAVTHEEKQEGTVLGATTDLPSTGANANWIIVALTFLVTGIGAIIVSKKMRRYHA